MTDNERFVATVTARISLVLATLFIGIGGSFLIGLAVSELATTQTAKQLVANTTVSQPDSSTTTKTLLTDVPVFLRLSSEIPAQLSSAFTVSVVTSPSVTVTNAYVLNQTTGVKTPIQPNNNSFIIPVRNLVPDKYQFYVEGRSTQNQLLKTNSRIFSVQSTTETSTSSIQITNINTDDQAGTPVRDQATLVNKDNQSTLSPAEKVSTVATKSDSVSPQPVATLEGYMPEAAIRTSDFSIRFSEPRSTASQFVGRVPIVLRTSGEVGAVELYLERGDGTARQFIGSTNISNQNTWLYTVDTQSIPNGTHRLIAVAYNQGTAIESVLPFRVGNSVLTTKEIPITESTPSTPATPTSHTTNLDSPANVSTPSRVVTDNKIPFTVTTDSPRLAPTQPNSAARLQQRITLTENTAQMVRRILKANETAINEVVLRYTELIQINGGVDQSRRTATIENIMAILHSDGEFSRLSSPVQLRVRTEILELVDRAERLELALFALQQNSTTTTSSLPVQLDIPIPNDTLVDTTSPREFGVVRDELLAIQSVTPIITQDDMSTTTIIHSEIIGQALPNTLVTLYIFSTPIMVTVQADRDGTFRYIYERELEDGEHEVFVALTNTDGTILAKSSGFRFIKEAAAFNVSDEFSDDVLTPLSATRGVSDYVIALALGVLAIGLVLLIFGIQTKRRTGIISDRPIKA